jgi:GNAT superfamily N-acetyltransferase
MTLTVSKATSADIPWLLIRDNHVPEAWLRRCVDLGEYLIAKRGDAPVGYLRFSWFWGTVPFMDQINVLEAEQRRGAGTALVQAWEAEMRAAGAIVLMTSSMSDEPEPQAWHRRNGFKDSGALTFGPAQETPEVFFIKTL